MRGAAAPLVHSMPSVDPFGATAQHAVSPDGKFIEREEMVMAREGYLLK
jgi:hypothetical protein